MNPSTQTPPPLATPPTQPVNFNGVEASLTAHIIKSWWKILLVLLGSIGIILSLATFTDRAIYGIAPFIIYLYYLQSSYEGDLFKEFARVNGFSYRAGGGVNEQHASLFQVGHDHHYSNVVTGPYKKWNFLLFVYSYTVGYGRSSTNYERAIMSVDFGIDLPVFLLRRHKLLQMVDNEGESLASAGYTQKLELEGDFDKHFQLHIKPDSQVDVLSILTPDVMQALVPLDKYELEMAMSGEFYIYCHSYINKKQELIDLYKILDTLTVQIGQYADRKKQILTASA